jgi:cellulose synthase/poly-beta-1,6-N-acetylglucosamine synthase-like glycosyltransferase
LTTAELIWIAFALAGGLAIGQSAVALLAVLAFRRSVLRRLSEPPPDYAPRALVLLPCKGVDDRLEHTIRELLAQNYPAYRVCVCVDSPDDPAKSLAERLAAGSPGVLTTVVSAPATRRAQKIENLLAGIAAAGDWPEVYAFIDSDAVPHANWLRHLAGPLDSPDLGACTGFRWYPPGRRLVTIIRSTWNAVSMTWMGDHKQNFCWGGSMAVRRATFDSLDIRARWDNALSEDYQVTRTVRRASLAIRFVPQCVIPCDGDASWPAFLTFARRQLIITRVCEPRLWATAVVVSVNFTLGYVASFAMLAYGGLTYHRSAMAAALAVLGVMYAINVPRAIVRQVTVARLVPPDARSRWMWLLDVLTSPLLAIVNTGLMIASGLTNRFDDGVPP